MSFNFLKTIEHINIYLRSANISYLLVSRKNYNLERGPVELTEKLRIAADMRSVARFSSEDLTRDFEARALRLKTLWSFCIDVFIQIRYLIFTFDSPLTASLERKK